MLNCDVRFRFQVNRFFQARNVGATNSSFGAGIVSRNALTNAGASGTGIARFRGPIGSASQTSFLISETLTLSAPGNQGIILNSRLIPPGIYEVQYNAFSDNTLQPSTTTSIVLGCAVQLNATPGMPSIPQRLDITRDGAVTAIDLLAWLAALTDANADGTIDVAPYGDDAATIAAILQGQGNLGDDCDLNGFPDIYDIAVFNHSNGTLGLADIDMDGVPDLCEPCIADVDDGSGTGMSDGGVTIDDLLYYLVIFELGDLASDVDDGSATGTPDGGVTIDDLLYFLQRFEAGC